MANELLKAWSTRQFKYIKPSGEEIGGLTIGQLLNLLSQKQGVACDGVINGLELNNNGEKLKLTFETINSVDTMTLRDCDGTIVFSVSSSADPQAATDFYRATLTGTDDANPTASVARNDLSAAIVWARTGEGVYEGTLASAFTANKTTIQLTLGSATGGIVLKAVRTSANVVTLSTFAADGTTPADFIGTINVTIAVEP